MHLIYVLNCAQFFNTLDTDFFPNDSHDDEDDDEGAKKHKVKHVREEEWKEDINLSVCLSLSRSLLFHLFSISLSLLSFLLSSFTFTNAYSALSIPHYILSSLDSGTHAVTTTRYKSPPLNSTTTSSSSVSMVARCSSSSSTTSRPMPWSNSTASQYWEMTPDRGGEIGRPPSILGQMESSVPLAFSRPIALGSSLMYLSPLLHSPRNRMCEFNLVM